MMEGTESISSGGAGAVRPAASGEASIDGAPEWAKASLSEPTATVKKRKKKGKRKKRKKRGDEKPKIGTSRGIETMFRTSYRTHMDLSALADTKANIMISINGIIISILLASIAPKIDTNPWLLIPTAVLLITCLVSIVYAVLAARPRVRSDVITLEDVRDRRANILFFGHFSSLSRDDFVAGMTDLMLHTDALYQSMIRDIYNLGTVLKRKFELLRVAYTVFMFGLIAGIVLFIGVFIWVVLD